MDNRETNTPNRLAKEKSPYLLQHACNPVDWHPWGDEAFEKAQNENKPIFLSIGYSTCHWCHVMAHESFEDDEVAKLLNDAFVCIKVDREERPDIDSIYMTVCQMLTGSGGWPLTIVMAPDKKPFFAGTYFPKESRFGRIGMLDLVPRMKEFWLSRRSQALESADEIFAALQSISEISGGENPGEASLAAACNQLAESFDDRHGGFGNAPKFPASHQLFFLLRFWKRARNQNALAMVEKTLDGMRYGGIYDQIGFGFHRYSVDEKWLVPHFEKMLYDQALLAIAYTEAYQATGKKEYAETAHEILTYVLRDMTDPGGGFYASEDADSEGEEGKFYLWTEEQVRKSLNREEAELAIHFFNVEKDGNFYDEATRAKTEKNILHITSSSLQNSKMTADVHLKRKIEAARRKLFKARQKRVRPHKDDKILTDWNGLMIASLAKAAAIFNRHDYSFAAVRAVDFILAELRDKNGRLLHRYRDKEAAVPAYLNDYAFFIWGLLELYEATLEIRFFQTACLLNRDLLEHFWDEKNSGFYLVAADSEQILARMKEIYDGAIPSGNSVAMLNLLRLSRMTGDASLEEKARGIARSFSRQILQAPSGHTMLLTAMDFAIGPTSELVICGERANKKTKIMLDILRKTFLPNKVVLFRHEAASDELEGLSPFTSQMQNFGDFAVYVCRNQQCHEPITDPEQFSATLQVPKS